MQYSRGYEFSAKSEGTQKPHSPTHPPTHSSSSLLLPQSNPIHSSMDRPRSTRAFNPNRLRSLLTSPSPAPSSSSSPFELTESDLFASSPDRSDGDAANPPPSPPVPPRTPNPIAFSRRSVFPRPTAEGILAALPSSSSSAAASLSSSPSSSSSSPSSSSARMIPPIPKPRREFPQPPQYQSAPVNVPVVPSRFKNRKGSVLLEEEEEEEKSDGEDEEMLPPHEIVARARAKESPMTMFSVLEGAGRTLKGRDLRQVRNAVWRKTGFLN